MTDDNIEFHPLTFASIVYKVDYSQPKASEVAKEQYAEDFDEEYGDLIANEIGFEEDGFIIVVTRKP